MTRDSVVKQVFYMIGMKALNMNVKNIQLNHPFIYSDDKQQFGVVTDRAQGGSSLEVQPLFKITSMFLCQNRLPEKHDILAGWLC